MKPKMRRWYHSWGPIRAILQEEFSFSDIKLILSLAGLDATTLRAYQQVMRGGSSKGQLMTAIDAVLADMEDEERQVLLAVTVEEVLSRKPDLEERLQETLNRLGLAVADGVIVPIEVFDPRDLEELPEAVAADLLKSVVRLRNGDPSGTVSAACGAVESVTSQVYVKHGEPGHETAAFQENVNVSLRLTGALSRVQDDLESLGWSENDAKLLRQNLRKALNSGAYVMQQLRPRMGDVHGSKPTVRALAFESIKWAEILTRLLMEPKQGEW